MTATRDPHDTTQRLEQAIDSARQLLSELNSASKDIRRTMRDVQRLLDVDAQHRIDTQVSTRMDQFHKSTSTAMEEATEKIFAEFKRLGDMLMAVDQAQPLEQVIEKVVASGGGKRKVATGRQTVRVDLDPTGGLP